MTDGIIKIKSTQGLGSEKESIELQTLGSFEIKEIEIKQLISKAKEVLN